MQGRPLPAHFGTKGPLANWADYQPIGLLADTDDATQWTTQAEFGLSEGLYMILPGPSGANNGMPLPLRIALWRDLADFLETL